MKKASKAFFSVVIMLTLAVLTATPASATSKKDSVFSYLTERIGFSTAAACGIMANIEHESDFDPTEVIIDSNGLPSGGLCQWNGSRFSNLKSFCNRNGYNYLSVNGQLEYLKYELTKKQYKHIYNYLKDVPNTAQGAYDAAYYWCYYFEVPASRGSKSVKRGNSAKNSYWKQYSQYNLKDVSLSSESNKDTLDFSDKVKLSWNSAGKNCTSYTLYLSKYNDGEYKNAKKISLSSDEKSYTLKLSGLKTGKYKVNVVAKSAGDSKKSNSISFTLKCKEHDYTCKTTKKATVKKQGINTYTCKKCGKQYEKSIPIVITENSGSFNINTPVVKSVNNGKAVLSFSSKKKVDGYQIYKYNGEKWVKIATTKENTATVKELKNGKTYKLKVRAFIKSGGNISVVSHFKKLEIATAPESTFIRSVGRPSDTSAIVSWNEADGANGYLIYAATSKKGKYKKVAEVTGNKTSCTVTGLKKGKTYYFKIKAFRKAENNVAYSALSA